MLNKAILIGRLTADPELKQTQAGVSVCTFSIAVDRRYQKDGSREADFLDIVVWRGTAEFVARYFQKGHKIGVEGEIQTRSYTDKNGSKRKAWEIQADRAFFVESRERRSPEIEPPGQDFTPVEADGDLPF